MWYERIRVVDRAIADCIYEVVDAPHDADVVEAVADRVDELTDEYVLYE